MASFRNVRNKPRLSHYRRVAGNGKIDVGRLGSYPIMYGFGMLVAYCRWMTEYLVKS